MRNIIVSIRQSDPDDSVLSFPACRLLAGEPGDVLPPDMNIGITVLGLRTSGLYCFCTVRLVWRRYVHSAKIAQYTTVTTIALCWLKQRYSHQEDLRCVITPPVMM